MRVIEWRYSISLEEAFIVNLLYYYYYFIERGEYCFYSENASIIISKVVTLFNTIVEVSTNNDFDCRNVKNSD